MWLTTLLIIICFHVFYRLFKFWIYKPWCVQRYLSKQNIPGRYIPIVGELFYFRKAVLADDPMSYIFELEKKFGGYYHTALGPIARLIISDPLLVQGVLKTNAHAYHKSNLVRLLLKPVIGSENLLISEDNIHSQHRRLISPVFQHQNIISMFSLMIQITLDHLDRWASSIANGNNHITVDIFNEMTSLTLNIVTTCVFGSGLMKNAYHKDIVQNCITQMLKDIEHRTLKMITIIPILNRLPLPSKRRIDQSERNLRRIVQQIITERKSGLSKSACKGPDLLDLLLSGHGNDENAKFNDEELLQECLTFVVAGHETTATLMTWTLYNLATNPDICHQLEAEIDSIFQESNEELTVSKLSLLNYVELVLKESLRLHQPIPFLARTAIEDNTLTASDGKTIHVKKGTDIMLNIHMLHHSEQYWNEPLKFDPSRFSEPHSHVYFPFSSGPRSCIGQNFAMLEAKIMLTMMIKHFRVELVRDQKCIPDVVTTLRPRYGIRMNIFKR